MIVDIDHNIGELVTAQLEIVLGVPMVHMKPQKLNNQRGVLYALPVADVVSSAIALILMIIQCKQLRVTA